MIELITKKILMEDPTVAGIVGDRVTYGYDAQSNVGKSRIVVEVVVMAGGTYTSDGQLPTRRGQILLNCLAVKADDAYQLSEAAIAAMLAGKGTTIGGKILQLVALDNIEPEPILQEGNDSPRAFGYQIYFRVELGETNAT